jgi:hypothetical protein
MNFREVILWGQRGRYVIWVIIFFFWKVVTALPHTCVFIACMLYRVEEYVASNKQISKLICHTGPNMCIKI